MKKITLIIPCYNEEKGIKEVIKEVPREKLEKEGFDIEILVIDNNSKDKTAEVATEHGARVIFEGNQGKGHAIKTAFENLPKDTTYVVMLDGDNTYKPKEMLRLIELLESKFCDVVVGSRLEGNMNCGAMKFSHRTANWVFTFLTRFFYNANVTDTCTGYFAWTKESVDILNGHIKSKGFAIEAEMISKMARLGLNVRSVPITYDPRHGESKLSKIPDGIKIICMLLRNIKWSPKK